MGKTIKFGGTSLGTAELDKEAAKYVITKKTDSVTILVVSGQGKSEKRPRMYKLTDYAYGIINKTIPDARDIFFSIIEDNIRDHGFNISLLDKLLDESKHIIQSGDYTGENAAKIIGLPERVKARIMQKLLIDAGHETILLDYDRNCIFGRFSEINIDVDVSHKTTRTEIQLAARHFGSEGKIVIIPGFIGTKEGTNEMVTLERGMSDGTATYWGSALLSEEIEIHSDQDGICRVDPRLVSEAETIERLTYREAEAFSGLGAGIISYVSIKPAKERGIPIRILNTFNKKNTGTLIDHDGGLNEERFPVRAIAYVPGYVIAKVSEMPMNKPGVAAYVLGVFAKYGISIDGMKDGDSCMTYAFKTNRNLFQLLQELDEAEHPVDLRTRMTRISLIGEMMIHSRDNGKKVDIIASDVLYSRGIPVELRVSERSSVIKTFYVPEAYAESAVINLNNALRS